MEARQDSNDFRAGARKELAVGKSAPSRVERAVTHGASASMLPLAGRPTATGQTGINAEPDPIHDFAQVACTRTHARGCTDNCSSNNSSDVQPALISAQAAQVTHPKSRALHHSRRS